MLQCLGKTDLLLMKPKYVTEMGSDLARNLALFYHVLENMIKYFYLAYFLEFPVNWPQKFFTLNFMDS